MNYRKVDTNILEKLKKICGEKDVIYEDKEKLESYACDESGKLFCKIPEVVVKPENTEEVSQVMALANEYLIPVTPRGAGSGLAGASIPICGGIVLSMEKMNKIIEIDRINRVAVVEPGVITNDLCKKVEEEGLYYAGYPMSVGLSTIGGNVATNAGGSKVIRYGNTRKHVLGAEVVLPTGEILMLGGKRRKETWGYDLLDLLIGSEGTLCIFTKLILNLIPLPKKTVDLLTPFKSIEDVIEAIKEIFLEAKNIPTAIEFIDKRSIDIASRYLNLSLPLQDKAQAFLIIQIEGSSNKELEDAYEKVGKACLKNGALDVFVADNRANSEKIWRIRKEITESLKNKDPYVSLSGDMVVPVSEIPKMLRKIKEIEKKYGIETATIGHIGDGNLHPALFKPFNISPEEWITLSEKIIEELIEEAVKLGGAGSGEHGVGFLKKKAFLKTKTPKEIELMRGIKKLFDPNMILNPEKVI
ncbi:MAG: FAD-binding oxidoreductase [Synergistetes bacterium]|nr:FAD-binding oxidoreductase [Synergistota bacterium]MCX8127446.1 FAD-binding oxidoreductase [Synergistota bacterium]MDW8192777.1 FAD-binding oxidoreductase [Synergistota bacterium]